MSDRIDPPFNSCRCRRHPVWLALDAAVWLVFDRSILIRRRCPIHGACHAE